MSAKIDPGDFDCYARALPDEPMFILLARDPSAPGKVRAWAFEREMDVRKGDRPPSDRAMVAEARECAVEMERWRIRNEGAWR